MLNTNKLLNELKQIPPHNLHFFNYFGDIDENTSLEKLAEDISSVATEYKLIDFSRQDIHYYIHRLEKPIVDGVDFPSLTRFFKEYKYNLSKFNKSFKGLVFIDISEFKNYKECKESFRHFLIFIKSIPNITFFFVSRNGIKINNILFREINKYLSVERFIDNTNVKESAVNYFKRLAKNTGCEIPDDIENELYKKVNEFFDNNAEHPYEWFRNLTEKIIYSKMKTNLMGPKTITFDDLAKLNLKSSARLEPPEKLF